MIGWLDCGAGASGDMFCGALVDAGVPLEVLSGAVAALDVEPVRLSATPVTRHGLAATKVDVHAPPVATDRHFTGIRDLIGDAALADGVKQTAIETFTRLGEAEASAHRVRLDEVHFHEVGALDSLSDIVATCAAMDWLTEHRGLNRLTVSPVTAGGGVTRGEHGGIPLPAPATLAVLSGANAPVTGEVPYEACTPTGAALIATHAADFGAMPLMTVDTVGMGAGGRDPAERANVLRLVLGEPFDAPEASAILFEANVDDLDPRLWPQALQALFAAGASDAWLSPIVMKKGRAAHTLHVLCREETAESVRHAVFAHTSTIGLRWQRVGKHALTRASGRVWLDGHPVDVKLARDQGRIVNVSVEHADVVAAAEALGRPVKVALAQASALAAEQYSEGASE